MDELTLISTRRTAEILGITVGRVHALVQDKILPAAGKIGYSYIFEKQTVRDFAKIHRPAGNPKRKTGNGLALTIREVNESAPPAKPKTSVALTKEKVAKMNAKK